MYKVKVEAIHCMSCVRNIEDVIKENDGDASVQADLEEKLLSVETKLSAKEVNQLIEQAGYPGAKTLE